MIYALDTDVELVMSDASELDALVRNVVVFISLTKKPRFSSSQIIASMRGSTVSVQSDRAASPPVAEQEVTTASPAGGLAGDAVVTLSAPLGVDAERTELEWVIECGSTSGTDR